jgi:prolipoprotein diacylglyceryltransferase
VTRHPIQLYYSFASAAILVLLLFLERRTLRSRSGQSWITPLGILLYAGTRFSIDPLRAEGLSDGLALTRQIVFAAAAAAVAWLTRSWILNKKKNGETGR